MAPNAKFRLRFDKVALRFVSDVKVALSEFVPEGKTLIVTVTAPIRSASKTADALESQIQPRLARGPARLDFSDTINGNQIRACLVTGLARGASNVVGFVHNPDLDVDALLAAAQSLIRSGGRIGDLTK